MELILKQDVQHLGFKDDVVSVKDGYGRNYLIPRGFAVLATPSAKKALEETLKQKAFKEEKVVKEARETAAAIRALEIKIAAKVSGGNKLFGSVTNADLEEVIRKADIAVDKKYISIRGGTIKRTGKYEATVRLHREVTAAITFEIVAEAN